MKKQIGFIYDESRCIQCRTCEVACKDTRGVELGPRWRRVIETWEGKYPDVKRVFFSQSCLHCGKPACIPACPTGAISKRQEDGIVVVDREKCDGCRDCFTACPYDVPQFGSDGLMQKCDLCLGAEGEPACVTSCPGEALSYGVIDDGFKPVAGKSAARMTGATEPSVIIIKRA